MKKYTNQLIKETSPYLLQHAHNPVNWYPWGEEALQLAKNENKPILVSIGYAACHWCHVMEKESFEDERTAAVMNQFFVNIKIDREERPDLDHIYMDAVQAMTGSGGWPLNVFLTHEGKPFYGGTYFPPEPRYNRASWTEVLHSVSRTFSEKRTEVEAQAENLIGHITKSNAFGNVEGVSESVFTEDALHTIASNLLRTADVTEGGFGKAPKFPQTFSIRNLLWYYHFYKEDKALQQACLSLDKMIMGGIYDQVGGGFARYATDTNWLIPHFEKMLYDNALMVSVLSEAYQLTKKHLYKKTIEETLAFVERELLTSEGGFCSALDADSEGVEGKYYVWSKEEIDNLLGKDANIFNSFYNVISEGNWEGVNILNSKQSIVEFSAATAMPEIELELLLEKCCKKLLEVRKNRVPPLLDDKVLLGWNALLNIAYSKAFAATGNQHYRQMAVDNMNFLLNFFFREDIGYFHTYKNGQAKYPAFLDDLAYLVEALIHLQEITGNQSYLLKAREITEYIIEAFSEPETGFFYFTPLSQKDVIMRKKEIYDGAIPSGNAIMASNLLYLNAVFEIPKWKQRAEAMVVSISAALLKYPGSFGVWALQVFRWVKKDMEIVVTGSDLEEVHSDLLFIFNPCRVLQVSSNLVESMPLLRGKAFDRGLKIYLCENFRCLSPVVSLPEFVQLINNQ